MEAFCLTLFSSSGRRDCVTSLRDKNIFPTLGYAARSQVRVMLFPKDVGQCVVVTTRRKASGLYGVETRDAGNCSVMYKVTPYNKGLLGPNAQ